MGKGSLLDKQNRQSRLLGLLRSDDYWTISGLATELETSTRTINRDLGELSSQGIPIDSDRGRGGGVRLIERWGISKLNLSNEEVMDMLISFAITESMKSAILTRNIKSIQQKISQIFPPAQRAAIRALRKRILIGANASEYILETYSPPKKNLDKLIHSFFNRYRAQITYIDGKGEKSKRIIEIHFLLLNWPVWYLMCWDHLREGIRVFRVDRILSFKVLSERFDLHSKDAYDVLYDDYFKSI